MGCTPKDPRRLVGRIQRRLFWTGVIVNGLAAFAVATYLVVIFPPEETGDYITQWTGFVGTGLYLAFASFIGGRASRRLWRRSRRWLESGETPTTKQRQQLLRLPKRIALNSFLLWILAVPIMGVPALLDISVVFGLEVMGATTLAGLTSAATVFLVDERIDRK